MHTFTFKNFQICNGDGDCVAVTVQVDLEHADGTGWEVSEVLMIADGTPTLIMSETQFIEMFPGGQDVVNNSYEDAAGNEPVRS